MPGNAGMNRSGLPLKEVVVSQKMLTLPVPQHSLALQASESSWNSRRQNLCEQSWGQEAAKSKGERRETHVCLLRLDPDFALEVHSESPPCPWLRGGILPLLSQSPQQQHAQHVWPSRTPALAPRRIRALPRRAWMGQEACRLRPSRPLHPTCGWTHCRQKCSSRPGGLALGGGDPTLHGRGPFPEPVSLHQVPAPWATLF